MFKKRGALLTFIKLLINNVFIYITMGVIIIIILNLVNSHFNKDIAIDYSKFGIKSILLISFINSIISLGSSKYVTKAIRIDEKAKDEDRIKEAMESLKWRIEDQADDTFIFTSPLRIGIMREEIFIRFVETEIHITGPSRYVEDMIRLAKFPYASFEIITKE